MMMVYKMVHQRYVVLDMVMVDMLDVVMVYVVVVVSRDSIHHGP